MMTTTVQPYPVKITGQLDTHLSRWLWLLKWVLVIPHLLVLIALWAGFLVLTAFAFVAILFTGRYPRGIFDYNVGVLRWTWRVSYYAYGALGTDVYPPFTLADRPDYPARLHIDYPEELSRGLALVKWWLLALPHYLVVGVFVGGGAWVYQDADVAGPGGLVGLLVLIAGVVLLVTGAYPRPIFDFVLGMNRWALRVIGYAALMTDQYPPFRLDQGGTETGVLTLPRSNAELAEDATPHSRAAEPHGGRPAWTGGRVTAVTLGAVSCLLGLVLAAVGTGLLITDQVARDETGMIVTDTTRLSTSTAALVESDVGLPVEGPSWFYGPEQLGTLAISVTSSGERPLFVGLAPRDDVLRWLSGTAYDEVDVLGSGDGQVVNATRQGAALNPADAGFWVAQSTGIGEQQLTWEALEGDWAVVAMNADGSPGLTVRASAGATVPHLDDVGAAVLASGVVLLVAGGIAIAVAVSRGTTHHAQAV